MNFTHIIDKISKYDKSKIVFVGLGNELRGDDASGIVFLNKLKLQEPIKNSHFINAGTNPENHLDNIIQHDPELVVFIDSAEMNCNSGEIKFIDEKDITNYEFSTHSYSILLLKEFLINQKPMEILFIGIQPHDTSFKNGLSEPVKKSIDNFFRNEL